IEAGRRWLRLHLAATSVGVSMQPLSQALQEYPEQSALYAKVHKMLAGEGETVQMLGRIGYAAPVGPSPRWPLESRIVGT
ncbi:MAG: twin-arginine translocation pathway signal protein, partial [Pseudomonadota bacterium]